MTQSVETLTPRDVMAPLGPYSHIARYGDMLIISGTAGVDPKTNQLVGPDIASQTKQILQSFEIMLRSVGADFRQVLHINVFLADIGEFDAMNRAYEANIGSSRPARTTIGVSGLPKPGARVTMNLTAVIAQRSKKASADSPNRGPQLQ